MRHELTAPAVIVNCPRKAEHGDAIARIRNALNASLRGKAEVVEHALACMLARGHLLIEDLPGLGKTTLAKALATAIAARFCRLQCTPDLLPGDVTGFSIFNQKTREFEFLPGPVFADVLLVDEINRATPRTQSALLEAMAEHQVTVDNVQHKLSNTFFVIATQNPADHHGTFPLPEAQLDRFAMKLCIGYPSREHELEILQAAIGPCCKDDSPQSAPVIGREELHHLQQHVAAVQVAPPVRHYLVELAAATRSKRKIRCGLSPRGLLTWQRVSQARAFLQRRSFVIPDDIQAVAIPVLGARLTMNQEETEAFVSTILASVPVPAWK